MAKAWWRRDDFERGMDDEVRFHLEARLGDLMKAGLSRADAERRARLEFGNPEVWQERCRESKRLNLTDDLTQDLRFAARGFRRDAGVTATILVTAALGIGATTALFTVVDAVLFKPLPFPQPERLAMVASQTRSADLLTIFGPDFLAWRAECQSCEQVASYAGTWPANLAGAAEPDRIRVARVSDNLFAAVGVAPLFGRTFV